MTHSQLLRVIGQRLEFSKTSFFQMEHDGEGYTVMSDLRSGTAAWIFIVAAEFSSVTVSRFHLKNRGSLCPTECGRSAI
jgi:hypothetical protein